MNIDLMRKIDYYAGVPLCFLATGLVWLMNIGNQRGMAAPRKVMFIELSEMGSAIIVDPAMQKIKQHGAELFFCIFASNKPSLDLLGSVPQQNIFTIREKNLLTLAWDTLVFLVWMRQRKIDSVIDLELFSRYTALLTGLSGASKRVGFHAFHNEGLYRGAMLTHRVAYNPHQHTVRNFLALVNATLSKTVELPYSKTGISDAETRLQRLTISNERKTAIRAKITQAYQEFDHSQQRIVLINANASDLLPQRRWMPERYIALTQQILDQFSDVIVLLTGAPSEQAQAEDLTRRIDRDRCVNFAGKVRLGELPDLYSVSTVMVTNDSGPGHFSSVTDLRTFVIFGPETPALYGSLGNSTPIYAGLACSPCVSASNHRKTVCSDNVCLKAISVDEVFGHVRAALSSTPH